MEGETNGYNAHDFCSWDSGLELCPNPMPSTADLRGNLQGDSPMDSEVQQALVIQALEQRAWQAFQAGLDALAEKLSRELTAKQLDYWRAQCLP